MRMMLLAAVAAMAMPAAALAQAQHRAMPGPGSDGFQGRGEAPERLHKPDHRPGDGRFAHRRPARGDVLIVSNHGWNEGWALYNNRTWEADSYNDWWHERPWRSYPRWMQNNQACDRLWWGGGAWRCGW